MDVHTLDLKGVKCPFNYVKAKIKLSEMKIGEVLEMFLDDGEPIRNVPKSLEQDGHQVLSIEKSGDVYRVVVRKEV
ncbi:MAG: sulfurtransferase TusA family protein [Spirochaetia bacterium]|nr:sulfurtransferase TusA family protein [Spirochaetota bacterium]MCX8096444.1 sulfurtransferase TusA family protein [Spirochaetota bacterium]MDW8112752.1 sulfurtransferase TusA family protein [Spirochaetia bacterium]